MPVDDQVRTSVRQDTHVGDPPGFGPRTFVALHGKRWRLGRGGGNPTLAQTVSPPPVFALPPIMGELHHHRSDLLCSITQPQWQVGPHVHLYT